MSITMNNSNDKSTLLREMAIFDYVAGNQTALTKHNFELMMKQDPSLQQAVEEEQRLRLEFDEIPSPVNEFESSVVLSEQLRIATANLSESRRTMIELAYFHGYNSNEVAQILDCPVNSVKTRLFHARQNLKTNIEQQGAEV